MISKWKSLINLEQFIVDWILEIESRLRIFVFVHRLLWNGVGDEDKLKNSLPTIEEN